MKLLQGGGGGVDSIGRAGKGSAKDPGIEELDQEDCARLVL